MVNNYKLVTVEPDQIHQMAFEEGQPAENGDGYLFTAEEFDLFVERLLTAAAPQPPAPYQCGACANGCINEYQIEKDSPPALGGEPEVFRCLIGSHPNSTYAQMVRLDAHRASLAPYQAEIERLRAALKFYADREHYHFESGNWDTVSGEPLNILWCGEEPDFIEDGTVARNALAEGAQS